MSERICGSKALTTLGGGVPRMASSNGATGPMSVLLPTQPGVSPSEGCRVRENGPEQCLVRGDDHFAGTALNLVHRGGGPEAVAGEIDTFDVVLEVLQDPVDNLVRRHQGRVVGQHALWSPRGEGRGFGSTRPPGCRMLW